MRIAIPIIAVIYAGGFTACGKSGESEGVEAAKREAEAEAKKLAAEATKEAAGHAQAAASKLPVPMDVQVPCAQLIDVAGFTTALGEKDPLTVVDLSKSNKDTTSTCNLVRGGKRPSQKDQEATLKKERRLGVLAGDVVCNIQAYCSLLENEDHFKERCKEMGFQDSDALGGTYACLHVVAQGADDVYSFKLLDVDTRCVFEIRGGPSMVDNDIITKCAKAARDLIGPDNIKPAK
jgi:hypothetical protein